MKNYKLFLDDLRVPRMIYLSDYLDEFANNDWIIAKSFDEAVKIVEENGCPEYISFDNDLGEGKTGYDFAKWIVEEAIYRQQENKEKWIPDNFKYYVHSQNPVGKHNIFCLMENYIIKIKEGLFIESEYNDLFEYESYDLNSHHGD